MFTVEVVLLLFRCFFFQAEDGIRDTSVTGVQTCALPISRVGGEKIIGTDVRLIASTNRDLETAMRAHQFREDLYYRLNVIEIRIPPLRERREEIPVLVDHFLTQINSQYGRKIEIPYETMRVF